MVGANIDCTRKKTQDKDSDITHFVQLQLGEVGCYHTEMINISPPGCQSEAPGPRCVSLYSVFVCTATFFMSVSVVKVI